MVKSTYSHDEITDWHIDTAQPELSVLCCAVVVKTKGSASTVGAAGAPPVQVTCTWSERSGAAGAWAWKKLVV